MPLEIRTSDIKEYKNKKIKIKMLWRASGEQATLYQFETIEKANAFRKGVKEAINWLECEEIQLTSLSPVFSFHINVINKG